MDRVQKYLLMSFKNQKFMNDEFFYVGQEFGIFGDFFLVSDLRNKCQEREKSSFFPCLTRQEIFSLYNSFSPGVLLFK